MAEMLTSYAQNFEDVILWRALKHVRHGFYVDIGAHHPVVDSVSLAFHERGWRGIHVEPEPAAAGRLREARIGDEVLEAAVGRKAGTVPFYAIADTGLSTCDAETARRHAGNGYAVAETTVTCLPLAAILAGAKGGEVHWLKLDVEGSESDAIASWAPSPVRPWVVLVEAAGPFSTGGQELPWEPVLLGLGYAFVYFDGLNRFYLSAAHPELGCHFGPGPNVFDNFTLGGRATSPYCIRLHAESAAARQQALDLARAAEERASAAETLSGELRTGLSHLAAENRAAARMLAWCRKELRTTRRKLWREQAQAREARAACENLARERDAKRAEMEQAAVRIGDLWRAAHVTRTELDKVTASRSWRLTAPLRRATHALRAHTARTGSLLRSAGALLHHRGGPGLLGAAVAFVQARPRLKCGLLVAVDRVPGLRSRLVRLGHGAGSVATPANVAELAGHGHAPLADITALSAPARRAYRHLAAARAARIPA